MEHSFNIEHAEKYGILEAVIIKNLQFWITKNRANGKHFHDGKTWTYNSVQAWNELLSYSTENKIRRAIEKLLKLKVIIKGTYNQNPFDQTKWYAFYEENLFLKKSKNDVHEIPDAFGENDKSTFGENDKSTFGESANSISSDINTDVNSYSKRERYNTHEEKQFDKEVEKEEREIIDEQVRKDLNLEPPKELEKKEKKVAPKKESGFVGRFGIKQRDGLPLMFDTVNEYLESENCSPQTGYWMNTRKSELGEMKVLRWIEEFEKLNEYRPDTWESKSYFENHLRASILKKSMIPDQKPQPQATQNHSQRGKISKHGKASSNPEYVKLMREWYGIKTA